ncbi:hypothetical protein BCON_0078g00110 [Botryotinia convoluta]|uniref:Uncharacterized protein n=1 Tax=Botryotinia convoluta TaxID=54673 RepID=A0A4Z1I6R8_9HELO|nr:hypothetical protein BCON_0078g00110 [Botryotinia convoluta]
MPGASLKGHLMAKGFNAAAARQTLKVQKKHYRLVNERTDVKSQNWANSIRPQKEKMKIRILSREIVKRATPAFEINGTLFPSYHEKVVLYKLCSGPKLWKWNLKPEKVDNIKDFDIDVSGDDTWPSYFRFGGDKNGWHLVRNLHAMHTIDVSELVQRLTERYPYYKKRGVKEQTATRKESTWVDVCEPILVPETALELLQKKSEKAERERLEMERLAEISEEQN